MAGPLPTGRSQKSPPHWISLIVGLCILGGLLLLTQRGLGGPRAGVSPAPSPTPIPPTPTSWPRTRLPSPDYGMQAFLWWHVNIAERDLQLIEDAGFRWVKQLVAWRDIEGTARGGFEWARTDYIVERARAHNLNILFRIDGLPLPDWVEPPADPSVPVPPAEFAHLCGALAERYRGQVQAYQVWNEPNLSREWAGQPPNPAGYVDLLRACYVAIKRADPDALVVSAGLAPTGTGPPEAMPDTEFLIQMYEAGASPYFDLLGVHAPGFRAPPETSPEEAAGNPEYGGQRFFCFRHVEDLREIMVRYGDADKQIAILEMGWTTDPIHPEYAWFAVTEEQKADYLVRAFQYAREHWRPWIGPMFVYTIADPFWTPDDEQYWWAITEPGWPETIVRPAYEALKEMEKE
ncbi:MAG TPA: hypothetical protein G4O00_10545 [Thermoflexia bacterium]|nr:hypothetical protein [Thermoflexia bacterium]